MAGNRIALIGWLGALGLTIGLSSCRAIELPRPFSVAEALQFDLPSTRPVKPARLRQAATPCSTQGRPKFLVFGGGGAPSYNEIAIEKNVLYFQRTLKTLGFSTSAPQIYFANGNDGQKTVRYIDPKTDAETFKAPEIKGLLGPATWPNLQIALTQVAQSKTPEQPLFFYFTGHGNRNPQNQNNNTMILWHERDVTVQDFASQLDRLPPTTPIVTVMVQCYAGAFANLIYEKGDPQRPVALQTRCGFFATIKQRPSVGCTPSVDEADYEDYSSSFFAGLSGVNRVGQPVASADYDQDGRVSFREAHAFAKVDEKAEDLPLSTSESWLRDRADIAPETTMAKPIATVLQTARPEQKYVVETIAEAFGFDRSQSFTANLKSLPLLKQVDELDKTNLTRLQLELINIAAENAIREAGDPGSIAILDRLLQCENGSW